MDSGVPRPAWPRSQAVVGPQAGLPVTGGNCQAKAAEEKHGHRAKGTLTPGSHRMLLGCGAGCSHVCGPSSQPSSPQGPRKPGPAVLPALLPQHLGDTEGNPPDAPLMPPRCPSRCPPRAPRQPLSRCPPRSRGPRSPSPAAAVPDALTPTLSGPAALGQALGVSGLDDRHASGRSPTTLPSTLQAALHLAAGATPTSFSNAGDKPLPRPQCLSPPWLVPRCGRGQMTGALRGNKMEGLGSPDDLVRRGEEGKKPLHPGVSVSEARHPP